MSSKSVEEILNEIEYLYRQYSLEKRASTQPFALEIVSQNVKNYKYNPGDSLIRESLIEHSGSLPIIATALFPYIDDEKVDLGRSLTMLAFHDIGELIVGDEMVFTKKITKRDEGAAAKTLLHPIYHELYDDIESQNGPSAKFAKAIDKITPDILDYLTPAEITISRYKHFTDTNADGIIDLVKKFKRPYMEWNPFMTEFHDYLMERWAQKLNAVR